MNKRLSKSKGVFFSTREFVKFIRAETCLAVSAMAACGYLLFNPVNSGLLFLVMAVFLSTAAAYAYNHITDIEEDRINDRKLNFFVTSGNGMKMVAAMITAGAASALLLPLHSFFLFLVSIPVIMAYSTFRVKKIFLAKNLYTGLTMGLVFLIGVSASGIISADILYIFFAVFFVGFTGNMIGDVRGYEGDFASGAKTLPVMIGVDSSKRLIHFILLGLSIHILLYGYYLLYPIVPFTFLVSFFLAAGRQKPARYSAIISFIALSASLIINSGVV
jgi:geranylgeranylglycerol-phosphate geranylgeranyltransferase